MENLSPINTHQTCIAKRSQSQILAHGETVEPHPANQTNGQVRSTVVITNPQGLHMRPAMAFAQAAQKFSSSVTVSHGDQSVNGKSLMNLLLLAAEQGTELIVEINGDDAYSA